MASPQKYSPLDLARWLLVKALGERRELDQMALQRLLYCCVCHYACRYGEELLDEPLWAVSFGPVIESLFEALVGHGLDSVELRHLGTEPLPVHLDQDRRLSEVVDDVWRRYGHLDSIWLSNWAHAKGSPWDVTYNGMRDPGQEVLEIHTETIQLCFKALELPENGGSSFHC